MRRIAHESLHEGGIFEGVVGSPVDHQQHRAAVAVVVPDGKRVELQRRAHALLQPLGHTMIRNHIGTRAQHAATRLGLQLERRKAHYIGMGDEERREHRHFVEVARMHRGVEEHA